ncbi:hypothetical protein QLQ15_17845 [Lysobacter sp. LF1]|uniref:Uncharacterized protein n=1 Tax=Lysobacter stagni TaxID=3045172 RepID=A0ABT6XLZ4_9GAMM|nr:hypothetical protein [Lysobacter sp. LF1]MDI9240770.1 hypothetical protein [Lysobacter sp. LF1]
MGTLAKWLGIIFLGLIVVGFYGAIALAPNPVVIRAGQVATEVGPPPIVQPQVAPGALDVFTARDLAVAYDENAVAADASFKDKRFFVYGQVESIDTDFNGVPCITLDAGMYFSNPQLKFGKDAHGSLADLRKGHPIVAACTGGGDSAKGPMLRSCTLL